MATNRLNPEALVRLAIWARLFCAPIRRPRAWSGFDAKQWSRLMELASAVDRKTLSRFFGLIILLMLCSSLLLAVITMPAIVSVGYSSPASLAQLTLWFLLGTGFAATIATLLIYRTAVRFAPHHSLIERLAVQAGDAELIAQLRRQTFWIASASLVGVALILFTCWTFRDALSPFFEQWNSLIGLFNVVFFTVFIIQIFRRPRLTAI